jgi:putative ABC transport system permease protein
MLFQLIKIAFKSLWSNKTRTFLTVLGIMIGIASVIIVYSAGAGINGLVLGEIEAFGTDIIETEIKVPTTKKGMSSEQQSASALVQGVQVTTLTLEDMEDLDRVPNIRYGYAGLMGQEQVSFGNEKKTGLILGTSEHYIDIDQGEIESGRFFTEAEDKSLAKVVVLGQDIKEDLFGDADPIGKLIKIRQTKFRVIGVMEEKGAMLSFNWDDMIYMPVRTLQKRLMGVNHVSYLVHQLEDTSLADETAEEMRRVLRENHDLPQPDMAYSGPFDTGRDDFRVVTMDEMMETMEVVTDALTWLLLAIVAISLVVGGVGIMNIMYVVIIERTQEIGLRKAVGATNTLILLQFLIEALVITIAGGIVGVIFGALVSYLIAYGASAYGLEWAFSIPLEGFIVALVFSTVFGVLFGIYPARKAAKLVPIAALRKE